MVGCTCSKAGSSVGIADEPSLMQKDRKFLVPIEQEPLIGETPQDILQSWLTPNTSFYVRNHFSIPSVIDTSWKLCVDGLVDETLMLTLDDFHCLRKQTLPVTLECAGNNRSDLDPPAPGNQFQNGAVSTAIWSGVPLKDVLQKAGIKEGAVEVLFEGIDTGLGNSATEVEPYLRSLPMDVAMHPDTLLANEMNGEPLSVEHGAPLRLVVPGWYGMASVKWLRKISVIDYKFEGFFQTDRYIVEGDNGGMVPVSNIATKSLISWPKQGDALASDTYNVTGLAWSGNGHIRRVEFSDDGGKSWHDAELVGPRYRYAWQQWNFAWQPKMTGHHVLVARAEDEEGNLQPLETKWNRLGYVINGVRPVCVNIQEKS